MNFNDNQRTKTNHLGKLYTKKMAIEGLNYLDFASADHVFLPRCLAAAKDDINEEAQWILFLSLLIPYHSPNLPLSLSLSSHIFAEMFE